jgi:hypothetical protein
MAIDTGFLQSRGDIADVSDLENAGEQNEANAN